jgi:FMN phosphatase YigB (HAD superfamily)
VTRAVECVFFDIGGTLGTVDAQLRLHLFPDAKMLLTKLRKIELRLGIISNVPGTVTGNDLIAMLTEAGIASFFEPVLVVASTDVGVEKPNPSIFTTAATFAGLPPAKCLFVGESLVELIGAQAAGMCAQLRPPT